MRLKPACSKPTSLPSSMVTRASRSPSSTRSSAARTELIGSAIARAAKTVAIIPAVNATAPRKSPGGGDVLGVDVRLREPDHADHDHAENGHPGPERPGEEEAGAHAGTRRPATAAAR